MTNIYEKLRNLVLAIFSIVLWVFCLMALVTIILSIFNLDTYYTQLIRILMNINREDIQYLAVIMVNATGIILLYLLVAGYFNQLTNKEEDQEREIDVKH